MFTRIRQWFIRPIKKYTRTNQDVPVRYVKLPKNIWELDDSYKAVIRELSKR